MAAVQHNFHEAVHRKRPCKWVWLGTVHCMDSRLISACSRPQGS
jgi:hypothetical protein